MYSRGEGIPGFLLKKHCLYQLQEAMRFAENPAVSMNLPAGVLQVRLVDTDVNVCS